MKNKMTKFATLALCAGLAACSEYDAGIDPVSEYELAYDAAFIRTFGQPAADQDWGFGSIETRAVNVNGNMWEEIPEVTEEEQKKVFEYVNYTRSEMKEIGHKYYETLPEDLVTYWVTQVWSGTDYYGSYDTPNSKDILGSSKMNNLQIGEDNTATINENGELVGNWFHVNNFNAGDNANYGGNTLIENSGCADFAYHGTEDSKFHNKWIAVDGADIDPSLAGYYYICFDFVAWENDAYTNFRFQVPGNNPNEWIDKTAKLPGAWTVETAMGMEITYSDWVWDSSTNSNIEVKKTVVIGGEGTQKWSIDNVVGGNMAVPANDVYTDWIVRITKATPADDDNTPETPEEPEDGDDGDDDGFKAQYRIIAEDLSATNSSDFDFNDLVIDVEYSKGLNQSRVVARAAGGTLPLSIAYNGGEPVSIKDILAYELGITTTTMWNTTKPYSNEKVVLLPQIDGKLSSEDARDLLKIYVEKAPNEWVEIKGAKGNPAGKICVKSDFVWVEERTPIQATYELFDTWVREGSDVEWYDLSDEYDKE